MVALPLVKYSCDCIGLAPDANGHILMVADTRADCGDYGLYDATVGHGGKTFEPVDPERAAKLTADLHSLIADGYRFRDVQIALGIPRGT